MVEIPNYQEVLERLRQYIAGEWVQRKPDETDSKTD